MMTFRHWLKENAYEYPSLYETMVNEDKLRRSRPDLYPEFKLWVNRREWIIKHLEQIGVDTNIIATFKKAWKDYCRDVSRGFA